MKTVTYHIQRTVADKLVDYLELSKVRLNILVVFSSVLGYLIGYNESQNSFFELFFLTVGGFLVTASANTFNQILEKDFDALMQRTQNRPLPAGRVSIQEALIFGAITLIFGLVLLGAGIHPLAAILAFLSFFIYVFVYTPMKRISIVSVVIGAFPGAIPPLLGWVAATKSFGLEGGLLFALQFAWQFPHFWLIARKGQEDYLKAGYKIVPWDGKKDQLFKYLLAGSVWIMLPISFLSYYYQLNGKMYLWAAVLLGIIIWLTSVLYLKDEKKYFRNLIIYTLLYLPLIQLFYWFDKIWI